MPTLEELLKEYVPVGAYLRRRDASSNKPSPVLSAKDVLEIAAKELKQK